MYVYIYIQLYMTIVRSFSTWLAVDFFFVWRRYRDERNHLILDFITCSIWKWNVIYTYVDEKIWWAIDFPVFLFFSKSFLSKPTIEQNSLNDPNRKKSNLPEDECSKRFWMIYLRHCILIWRPENAISCSHRLHTFVGIDTHRPFLHGSSPREHWSMDYMHTWTWTIQPYVLILSG